MLFDCIKILVWNIALKSTLNIILFAGVVLFLILAKNVNLDNNDTGMFNLNSDYLMLFQTIAIFVAVIVASYSIYSNKKIAITERTINLIYNELDNIIYKDYSNIGKLEGKNSNNSFMVKNSDYYLQELDAIAVLIMKKKFIILN